METSFSLKHTIDQIVKEKGIEKGVILEALEQAVLTAANKKFRNTRDLEAHYNEEIGEVELFEFVTVVEEVQDSYREIDLDSCVAGSVEEFVRIAVHLGTDREFRAHVSRQIAERSAQLFDRPYAALALGAKLVQIAETRL